MWMQRHSNQFSESELVTRYERSTRTEYKMSACEDVKCDWKISWVIIVVISSDSFCVEIHYQERASACNSELWSVCKSAIALYLSIIKIGCNQIVNKSNNSN
jgi:hypothetical protein